mgnify:CR=1 FL=1
MRVFNFPLVELQQGLLAHEHAVDHLAVEQGGNCPLSKPGEVVEVNKDLEGDPALVNRDAESGAWFMKVKLSNPAELDELMDKAAYDKLVNG